MSDADDFQKKLLSNDQKWWEFLDPETYEVKNLPAPARASSALVDWSKKQQPTRQGPAGFGFFSRCDACGKSCPPDFTFCVYCGGNPRAPQSIYTYTVIIKEIESSAAREAVAELITESSHDLKLAEVTGMLEELPAVFNVHERRDRVAAMLARFAELGVYGKSFNVADPSVPWISETFETVVRSPKALAVFIATAIAFVAATFFLSFGFLPIGILALMGLFYYRLTWYRGRYEFNVNQVLDRCAGFEGLRGDIVDRLTRIRDTEMKNQFTVCLMEYYALHTQFRAYESEYGEVLLGSAHALRDLLSQIIGATGRYADLEFHLDGIEPAALDQRIMTARDRLTQAGPTEAHLIQGEIQALQKERQQYQQMLELKTKFQGRLRALAGSMEALRARVSSVRREKDARFEEIPMEQILRELDEELQVFEETVHAIES